MPGDHSRQLPDTQYPENVLLRAGATDWPSWCPLSEKQRTRGVLPRRTRRTMMPWARHTAAWDRLAPSG